MLGSLSVSRAMRQSSLHQAAIADRTILEHRILVCLFLDYRCRFRYADCSVRHFVQTSDITNGMAHRPSRTATDPGDRKPTRRPYMPGNGRWSALNLKRKAPRIGETRPEHRRWDLMQHVPATEPRYVRKWLRRCMSKGNGKEHQNGCTRANNHAKVEVSKPLATILHRRTTTIITHSTTRAAAK